MERVKGLNGGWITINPFTHFLYKQILWTQYATNCLITNPFTQFFYLQVLWTQYVAKLTKNQVLWTQYFINLFNNKLLHSMLLQANFVNPMFLQFIDPNDFTISWTYCFFHFLLFFPFHQPPCFYFFKFLPFLFFNSSSGPARICGSDRKNRKKGDEIKKKKERRKNRKKK